MKDAIDLFMLFAKFAIRFTLEGMSEDAPESDRGDVAWIAGKGEARLR